MIRGCGPYLDALGRAEFEYWAGSDVASVVTVGGDAASCQWHIGKKASPGRCIVRDDRSCGLGCIRGGESASAQDEEEEGCFKHGIIDLLGRCEYYFWWLWVVVLVLYQCFGR